MKVVPNGCSNVIALYSYLFVLEQPKQCRVCW